MEPCTFELQETREDTVNRKRPIYKTSWTFNLSKSHFQCHFTFAILGLKRKKWQIYVFVGAHIYIEENFTFSNESTRSNGTPSNSSRVNSSTVFSSLRFEQKTAPSSVIFVLRDLTSSRFSFSRWRPKIKIFHCFIYSFDIFQIYQPFLFPSIRNFSM